MSGLRKSLEEAKAEFTEIKQLALKLAKELEAYYTKGAPQIEAADFIAGKAATAASNIGITLSAADLILEAKEAVRLEATDEGIKIRQPLVMGRPHHLGGTDAPARVAELEGKVAGLAMRLDTLATSIVNGDRRLEEMSRRVGDLERERDAERRERSAQVPFEHQGSRRAG
jgi:hypothetical protein